MPGRRLARVLSRLGRCCASVRLDGLLRIDRPRIATAVHQLAAGLLSSRLLMGYMALGILSGFGNGGPAGLIAAVVNYGLLALYVVIVFLWTDKDRQLVERKHEMATVASRRRDATVIV